MDEQVLRNAIEKLDAEGYRRAQWVKDPTAQRIILDRRLGAAEITKAAFPCPTDHDALALTDEEVRRFVEDAVRIERPKPPPPKLAFADSPPKEEVDHLYVACTRVFGVYLRAIAHHIVEAMGPPKRLNPGPSLDTVEMTTSIWLADIVPVLNGTPISLAHRVDLNTLLADLGQSRAMEVTPAGPVYLIGQLLLSSRDSFDELLGTKEEPGPLHVLPPGMIGPFGAVLRVEDGLRRDLRVALDTLAEDRRSQEPGYAGRDLKKPSGRPTGTVQDLELWAAICDLVNVHPDISANRLLAQWKSDELGSAGQGLRKQLGRRVADPPSLPTLKRYVRDAKNLKE